jgi:rod shape-determining protein MreD
MLADAAKLALLLFVAVLAQVAVFTPMELGSGHPDIVLVTLLVTALLRGSIFGAVGGFWAGFLVDVATLGTLGFTSLLLTLAGYWIGRYGETPEPIARTPRSWRSLSSPFSTPSVTWCSASWSESPPRRASRSKRCPPRSSST